MKNRPDIPSGIAPSKTFVDRQKLWLEEMNKRKSPTQKQLEAVTNKLTSLGMDNTSCLLDFGAGRCELDFFLRTEHSWKGSIINVDPIIDGTDIESWWSKGWQDYTASITALQFVKKPGEVIAKLEGATTSGLVFVVYNQEVTNPLDINDFYESPITLEDWGQLYYDTQVLTLFGKKDDAILAWKDVRGS